MPLTNPPRNRTHHLMLKPQSQRSGSHSCLSVTADKWFPRAGSTNGNNQCSSGTLRHFPGLFSTNADFPRRFKTIRVDSRRFQSWSTPRPRPTAEKKLETGFSKCSRTSDLQPRLLAVHVGRTECSSGKPEGSYPSFPAKRLLPLRRRNKETLEERLKRLLQKATFHPMAPTMNASSPMMNHRSTFFLTFLAFSLE